MQSSIINNCFDNFFLKICHAKSFCTLKSINWISEYLILKYTLNTGYLKLENQFLTSIIYLNLLTIFCLSVTEEKNSFYQIYWSRIVINLKTNKAEKPLIIWEQLVFLSCILTLQNYQMHQNDVGHRHAMMLNKEYNNGFKVT